MSGNPWDAEIAIGDRDVLVQLGLSETARMSAAQQLGVFLRRLHDPSLVAAFGAALLTEYGHMPREWRARARYAALCYSVSLALHANELGQADLVREAITGFQARRGRRDMMR